MATDIVCIRIFLSAQLFLVVPIKFMKLFNHFRHQICATFDISPNKSAICTKTMPDVNICAANAAKMVKRVAMYVRWSLPLTLAICLYAVWCDTSLEKTKIYEFANIFWHLLVFFFCARRPIFLPLFCMFSAWKWCYCLIVSVLRFFNNANDFTICSLVRLFVRRAIHFALLFVHQHGKMCVNISVFRCYDYCKAKRSGRA